MAAAAKCLTLARQIMASEGCEESPPLRALSQPASHLSLTNASISRENAMARLSDAIEIVEGVQSRDCTPSTRHSQATPTGSRQSPSPSCGRLWQASPQLPQRSGSDLAARNGTPASPPGMAVARPRRSSRTCTFPSLGFRLVWDDAAPNASQDAELAFGEYEKMRTLGTGSSGTAVLLRHRRTGNTVVSKQVAVHEMERTDLGKVNTPYT